MGGGGVMEENNPKQLPVREVEIITSHNRYSTTYIGNSHSANTEVL